MLITASKNIGFQLPGNPSGFIPNSPHSSEPRHRIEILERAVKSIEVNIVRYTVDLSLFGKLPKNVVIKSPWQRRRGLEGVVGDPQQIAGEPRTATQNLGPKRRVGVKDGLTPQDVFYRFDPGLNAIED